MAMAIREAYEFFPKPLIIQAGANCDHFVGAPDGVQVFGHCSFSDFSKIVKSSSVIVTHGGVGSVKEAISAGLHPAVFVRQGSSGEHIDDHQVDWCRTLFAAHIATEIWHSRDLFEFLENGEYRQEDMTLARRFFDDTKLKSAVHAFIRNTLRVH
jgi:UDP-N-acetylglucosamine transferase subunit ALG13